MGKFDKWTVLRIIEVLFIIRQREGIDRTRNFAKGQKEHVGTKQETKLLAFLNILVLACLVFKRVSDDEARSLFLYLQKLSREWSLLNNITWSKVGSSLADATYGGYLVITSALLIGKLCGELPTEKRITEWVFLSVGAVLFIILGSLAFAAIDSVPHNLIDNAAILGTISCLTGALFLLDMGAPKARKKAQTPPAQIVQEPKNGTRHAPQRNSHENGERPRTSITQQVYEIEREIERSERSRIDDQTRTEDEERRKTKKEIKNNGIRNGGYKNGGAPSKIEMALKEPAAYPGRSYIHLDPTSKGYKQMKDEELDIPKRFGIYGRDVVDNNDTDTDETASLPPKIELHTPVWANIRKGRTNTSNYGVVGFR